MSEFQSKEYVAWVHMNARCGNPDHPKYRRYGGRGIEVCADWRDSYKAFLFAVGRAPSPNHTLDRYPNNDGNYEPGNVRWATWKEQGQNRCTNKKLRYKGELLTIAAWAERFGLDRRILWKRLAAGWTLAAAIETPKAARGPSDARKALQAAQGPRRAAA